MDSYMDLPPRTPADGCESCEVAGPEYLEYSFEDVIPYIKIVSVSQPSTFLEDSKTLKHELSTNMKKFAIKRASLKRREGALYQKHREMKKKLHDFLNTAFQEESTPKKSIESSQIRHLVYQCPSPSKLLTILKNGKKCTFC